MDALRHTDFQHRRIEHYRLRLSCLGCLIYSIFSTAIAHLVGRKLKNSTSTASIAKPTTAQPFYACRDHAEQIAFYNGGEAETGRLKQRYLRIRDNWRRLTNCEFRQETFWATYVRISIFIPILATLPMYLAKTMTFGDMMQTRTSLPAFKTVLAGLLTHTAA